MILLFALFLGPPFENFPPEPDQPLELLAVDPIWPLPEVPPGRAVQDQEDPFAHEPKPELGIPRRSPEPSALPLLSLDAQGWLVTPTAWMFITRGSEPGSATVAQNEVQIDFEPKYTVALGATLHFLDPHGFRIEAVRLDESGRNSVQSDFIYHGTVYPAGRQVETRVDLLLVDADYLYTWRPMEGLTLTGHAGMEYWRFDSRVRTVDGGPLIDERRGFSSAFGKIGVDGSLDLLPGLAVRASILGGLTTSSRYFYDVQAGLEWKVTAAVSLTLGYRVHDLRFHQSTNEAELYYAGPTAGLEIRF